MSLDSKGKECYKLQNSPVLAMWTKSAMHCQIPMLSNLFVLVHSRFKQTNVSEFDSTEIFMKMGELGPRDLFLLINSSLSGI